MLRRRGKLWSTVGFGVWIAVLTPGSSLAERRGSPASPSDASVDIAAMIAGADGDYDGADYVVVHETTDVDVADNGLGTNTHTRVIKILTDAGIRSQSTQRWRYDPLTNDLKLKAVRIHRNDGKVDDVDLRQAIEQPSPAGIIFWGEQQLVLNIPGLEIGDSVEATHVKSGFNTAYLAGGASGRGGGRSLEPPMPGHWYDVVRWQESVPILKKRYTVRIPKDKPLQYEIVNGALTSSVRFDEDHVVYNFEKKDIPAFKSESRMISRSDVVCKLVLATLKDWHDKARWFYEANEPSFKTDEAIRKKVKEIVTGLDSDEEKIAALNHWVAENVRYVGTSRGAHEGYTTHPVIQTFHDRGGVCKDKAGMLVAMLREAGFESYIVMTMAGSRVEETPADQFNHAVTCVRKDDGTLRMLDPTWLPKSREMWSSAEQLQTVVFGTPDGKEGKQLTAYSPPEENAANWRSTCTLLQTGELYGSIRVSTLGCPETSLRRAMGALHPEDRWGRIEKSLAILSPTAVLVSSDVTDPVDFSRPAVMELDFAVTDFALGEENKMWVRLPSFSGALTDIVLPDIRASVAVKADDRKYPLRIRSTRRFDCRETIKLPADVVATRLPDPVSIDGPAASMNFEIHSEPGRVHYECQVDLKKHKVPVEDYANYKEVIDRLIELGGEMILCERGEQRVRR